MQRHQSVDGYIEANEHWREQLIELRGILQRTELEETVKWGAPCYTWKGKNVVGLAAFKTYVGLWFHQGALLTDTDGVLINAQEGKTRALRQWRFDGSSKIPTGTVTAYVQEAMALVERGSEIKPDRSRPLVMAPELADALAADAAAADSFEKLTPGRQREYSEYILEAKRADTRQRRVAKVLPMICQGVGLNDRYRPG